MPDRTPRDATTGRSHKKGGVKRAAYCIKLDRCLRSVMPDKSAKQKRTI